MSGVQFSMRRSIILGVTCAVTIGHQLAALSISSSGSGATPTAAPKPSTAPPTSSAPNALPQAASQVGAQPEAPDQVTTLEESAQSLYKTGKFKKARRIYSKALESCNKETAASSGLQKVRILLGLGDCCYELDKYPEAIKQYSAALGPAKRWGTDNGALIERCLDSLGSSYFHDQQFEEAASLYEQLVKYDETVYGADSIQLLWTLLDLSSSYRELNRIEKRKDLQPRIMKLLLTSLTQQDNEGRAEPAGTEQKRPLPIMVWRPLGGNPDAIILCIHGLGLHATSFQGFAERMNKNNIGIAALDVRGFGSWQVARGHENLDFNRSLRDIEGLLSMIHTIEPGKPVFLLGESMGGAIVLRFASLHPDLIDGIISSVPADQRYKQKSDSLKVAVNFVRHKNTQMSVDDILDRAATRDSVSPDVFEDPLMRAELSPKELLKFQLFMIETTRLADKIQNIPVLMVQGMKDRLVKPGATISLYNNIASADRNLLLVGQCQHLIFEEVQTPDTVFDSVLVWLKDHMKKEVKE
jgi:acylglycerol lipase